MELKTLAPGTHWLHGAVNCGLVETERGVLAIDTGLDRSAASKILRAAESLGRPVVAILNTHAHADHHGGNAQIVRRTGAPVYAPAVEAEVIREPRYEAVYLFGGAAPVSGLVNKFLIAEASPVDHVVRAGETVAIDGRSVELIDLAGHSLAQVGARVGGVLFAADGFFGREPLEKHGIPYLVDAGVWRERLGFLGGVEAEWFVPGHGDALSDPRETIAANVAALDRGFGWIGERLRRGPAGTEDLLAEMGTEMGMRLDTPSAYVLNRTTLLGFLSAMERAGDVRVVLEGGRWLWATT